MSRKLTITIPEEVYEGPHAKMGPGRISRSLDALARPHGVDAAWDDAYKAMARDGSREAEAAGWTKNLTGAAAGETR